MPVRPRKLTLCLVAIVIFGVVLALITEMNHETPNAGYMDKKMFSSTVKTFVARYNVNELTVSQVSSISGRYKWLVEVKSQLAKYRQTQAMHVRYLCAIEGKTFVIITEENAQSVIEVRIHPGRCPVEISAWLTSELRNLSPELPVTVMSTEPLEEWWNKEETVRTTDATQ